MNTSPPVVHERRRSARTVDWYRARFNAATVLTNIVGYLDWHYQPPATESRRFREKRQALLDRAAAAASDVLELAVLVQAEATSSVEPASAKRRFRRTTTGGTDTAKGSVRRESVEGPDKDDPQTAYWRLARQPVILLAAGILDLYSPRRARPEPKEKTAMASTDVVDMIGGALPGDAPPPGQAARLYEKVLIACPTVTESDPDVVIDWRAPAIALAGQVEREVLAEGRTRYNLACFWASAERFDKALWHLTSAVHGSAVLRASAEKDPSLQPLRMKKRKEWELLISAPVAGDKDSSPGKAEKKDAD